MATADQARLQAALDFLKPDETAAQFLARNYADQVRTGVDFIDRQLTLRSNSVLEISGLAGSGKTELLYSIAATCILPPFHASIPLHGHGTNILYFDLDCKFDTIRLIHILQSRAQGALNAFSTATSAQQMNEEEKRTFVEGAVTTSIRRLHLISCPTSFHFLSSLKVIKPIATELALNTPNGLGAVFVDNVASHYYVDRTVRLRMPSMSSATTIPSSALTLHRVHAAMVYGLRHLQHSFRVPVVTTKHTFALATSSPLSMSSSNDLVAWTYREVMLKSWQDFVTQRIVVTQGGGGGGGGSGGGGGKRKMYEARVLLPTTGSVRGGVNDQHIMFTIDDVGVVGVV